MMIKDVMSAPAVVCAKNDPLNQAARLMWERDCGVLPVVGEDGRIAGILTDRDICMAAYTQGRPLAEIPVEAAMARRVFTCRADDTIDSAGEVMGDNQVRRLPVLDADDRPLGVVSLNDLVRHASVTKDGEGLGRELIRELAQVSRPRTAPAGPGGDLPSRSDAARASAPPMARERRAPRVSH